METYVEFNEDQNESDIEEENDELLREKIYHEE
jgi:hypothetical protein